MCLVCEGMQQLPTQPIWLRQCRLGRSIVPLSEITSRHSLAAITRCFCVWSSSGQPPIWRAALALGTVGANMLSKKAPSVFFSARRRSPTPWSLALCVRHSNTVPVVSVHQWTGADHRRLWASCCSWSDSPAAFLILLELSLPSLCTPVLTIARGPAPHEHSRVRCRDPFIFKTRTLPPAAGATNGRAQVHPTPTFRRQKSTLFQARRSHHSDS